MNRYTVPLITAVLGAAILLGGCTPRQASKPWTARQPRRTKCRKASTSKERT
jgi:hypothetical protein